MKPTPVSSLPNKAAMEGSYPGSELRDHVTTKRNFIISELSFVLDGAHRADTFNDKTVWFRCLLEPLLAAP